MVLKRSEHSPACRLRRERRGSRVSWENHAGSGNRPDAPSARDLPCPSQRVPCALLAPLRRVLCPPGWRVWGPQAKNGQLPAPRHSASVLEGAVRLPSVGIQSDEQGLSTSDRRTETQETHHTGDGRTAWRPRGAQKGPAAARRGLPSGAGRRSSESRVPRRSWDRGAPPCGS